MGEMRVIAGAPVFLVADVQKAADYYSEKLGFKYDKIWGDPPAFCMVWRNDQCVMLSQVRDKALVRPVSSVAPEVWDAYFWVNDIEAFHKEFTEKGAIVHHEKPFKKVYDVIEFNVSDLDGYIICFGEGL